MKKKKKKPEKTIKIIDLTQEEASIEIKKSDPPPSEFLTGEFGYVGPIAIDECDWPEEIVAEPSPQSS